VGVAAILVSITSMSMKMEIAARYVSSASQSHDVKTVPIPVLKMMIDLYTSCYFRV